MGVEAFATFRPTLCGTLATAQDLVALDVVYTQAQHRRHDEALSL